MENIVLIICIICIILTMATILKTSPPEKDVQVIAYAQRKLDWNLFSFIIPLIASLVSLVCLVNSITEAQKVLPVTNISQLFNQRYMDAIVQQAIDNVALVDFMNITSFRNEGPKFLIFFISFGCGAVTSLHSWLQREAICQKGLIRHKWHCPWQKVTDYQWGEFQRTKTIAGYKEYYPLRIFYQYSRLEAFFCCQKIGQVKLHIAPSDKGKVDIFLTNTLKKHHV